MQKLTVYHSLNSNYWAVKIPSDNISMHNTLVINGFVDIMKPPIDEKYIHIALNENELIKFIGEYHENY